MQRCLACCPDSAVTAYYFGDVRVKGDEPGRAGRRQGTVVGSQVSEFVKELLDKAPDIIGKAAQSPLGLASLSVLVLGALAGFLFHKDAGKFKVAAFAMVVGAVLGFIALFVVPAHPPEPADNRHSPIDAASGTTFPASKGWAYFGAQDNNGKWFETHFEVQSAGNRPPRPGDTIVVTRIPTNIRQGPIEDTAGGWALQPKIPGTNVKLGDQFIVDRVVEVYPKFYWVEIRQI
jgi:hypothetical protein